MKYSDAWTADKSELLDSDCADWYYWWQQVWSPSGHMLITPTFLLTHKWSVWSCFTFTMWKPRYSSRVISAVMLRSHCSLAMLNCAWMAQPHAAFQLAHSDIAPCGAMAGKKKNTQQRSSRRIRPLRGWSLSGDRKWSWDAEKSETNLYQIRQNWPHIIVLLQLLLRKLVRTN